jgi:hypothetical protein
MCEGIVVNKCIEVHPIGKSCGIWGEPSAEQGHVETAAVIDEARGGIAALRREAPGAEDWAIDYLFPEGAVAILSGRIAFYWDQGSDVALEIVDRREDLSLELDGNGRADFGVGRMPKDAQFLDS